MRLLLVEDNDDDAALIREHFAESRKDPVEIRNARTLAEGISLLKREPFDCVLLDPGLPDSVGLPTLRACLKHAQQIPIVVLTGNEDEALADQGVFAGAQDYLNKNQLTSALIGRAVRHAISRQRLSGELKTSLEELRASEALLRAILDNTSDAIITCDQASGRIVSLNNAAERIFGYPRELITGQSIDRLIPNVRQSVKERSADEPQATDNNAHPEPRRETSGHRRDGVIIPIDVAATVLRLNERDLLNLVVRDLTEQKRVAGELNAQAAVLARMDRVCIVNQMTASLAHQLNQPLCAIVTNSHAGLRLLRTNRHHVRRQVEDLLGDIEEAGKKAGTVVQQLRDFMRNREHQRKPLHVNAIIRELIRMISMDARHHAAQVRFSLRDHLPRVHADTIQLQQVILNLVHNAFEAVRQKPAGVGEVEISTGWVEGKGVVVTVRDNGDGVAEAVQPKLFEAFVTTKPGGLGLGLAVCQSIIESHGGRIWGHSNAEGGATFSFALPPAREESKP